MKAENYYYFIAEYSDGTQYEQGADDLSIQRTDKNAFFDIWYDPIKPINTLQRFRLVDANGTNLPEFAVNLKDLCFEVNGVAFYPYNTVHVLPTGREEALVLSNPRLIYRRINEASTVVNGKMEQVGDPTLKVVGYILGFQANDRNGRNHEFLMRI